MADKDNKTSARASVEEPAAQTVAQGEPGTSGVAVAEVEPAAVEMPPFPESGDRIAIGSYMGKRDVFDNAIADFSAAYADQNERDHAALVEAVKSGRVTAVQGV